MTGSHPNQLHTMLAVVEDHAVFKKNGRMLEPISLGARFSGYRLVVL